MNQTFGDDKMSAPRYTLKIGGVAHDYISVKISWAVGGDPHVWEAVLRDHGAIVNKGDSVDIERDNQSIFKGELELKDPRMGKSTSMFVLGRHTGVKIWRKWIERYADVGGFWTNYYMNKVVEFLLWPSRSDRPDIDNKYRRVGWGIDPTGWVMDASDRADADHEEENVANRLNTIGWQLGKNQAVNEYIEIDLGASTTICGIRIENRTAHPEEFIRNYKIETSTTGAWGGEEVEVASKSNNRAINIVESWTEAATRYIRVICTGNFADDWRIGNIFVYESDGAISGISVGTIDEHLPLNCSLMNSNANSGQTNVVVKEGWRFKAGDDVIVGDDDAEETNSIDSISGNTLTMDDNLDNNYTTAKNGFVTNLDRYTEINLEYMRRNQAISKIVTYCTTDDIKWEWGVSDAGAVNMGARVGTDKSGSISFTYAQAAGIERASNRSDDRRRADKVLVLGRGKGSNQDLNASGWIGSGEYELVVTDGSLETKEACEAKARAIIEEYGSGVTDPNVRVNDTYATGLWGIGDDVTLTESKTGLAGSYKVKKLTRFYNVGGEQVTIEADFIRGKTKDTLARLQRLISKQEGDYPEEIFDEIIEDTGLRLFYEAELMTLDPSATVETDATSSNGEHVKMAQAGSGLVWWGPGVALKSGSYRVVFKCKVTSNASSSNLIIIDVYSVTDGTTIATLTLTPDSFAANNTWEPKSFTFNLTSDYTDLELRANNFSTGITDFYCDWIGITSNWIVDDPPGAPGAPANPTATSELSAVRVQWDENTESDLDHYIIYRDTSPTPTAEYRRVHSNVLIDVNVAWATTYYYRIKAVDWTGNASAYSNEVSAAPAYIDPADLDIELKPWVSDLNVIWDDVNDTPPTDWNHILWGQAGDEGPGGTNATITFADGTTRAITTNENANVADGLWWIYWTDANTVLQWSQTYSDAIGAGKGLMGIVEINNAGSESPTILLFDSYKPTIGAGVIGAYAIYSKHMSADWFTGKNFRTAVGVGEGGGPAGIRFNANELAGYTGGTTKGFYILNDGVAYFAGGKCYIDADGISIQHDGLVNTIGIRLKDDGGVLKGTLQIDIADGIGLAGSTGAYLSNLAATAYLGVIVEAIYIQSAGTSDITLYTAGDIIARGGNVLPFADGTQQLGENTTPLRWSEIHVDSIVLDESPDADHTANGIMIPGTAGENLVFGDFLYYKSDGKWWKSDADAVVTMPISGMATGTIAADASGEILVYGVARDDTWAWTVGALQYASTTTARLQEAQPSGSGDQVQAVSEAKAATIILFKPCAVLVEIV